MQLNGSSKIKTKTCDPQRHQNSTQLRGIHHTCGAWRNTKYAFLSQKSMKNCVQIQGHTRRLFYRQLTSIMTITTFKIQRLLRNITEQYTQLKLFIRKETKTCYTQEHQNPPNYGVDNTPTIHDHLLIRQSGCYPDFYVTRCNEFNGFRSTNGDWGISQRRRHRVVARRWLVSRTRAKARCVRDSTSATKSSTEIGLPASKRQSLRTRSMGSTTSRPRKSRHGV